jgi:hypothetical protein
MNETKENKMDLESFHPQGAEIDALIEQALNAGFESDKGRLPKDSDERRQWIRTEQGDRWLNAVPPIAFTTQLLEGTDLSEPDSFLRPSVQVTPVINPLFHALMVKLGAKPNGARTYEVSAGKGKSKSEGDAIATALRAILEVIPGGICYVPSCVEQGEKHGFQSHNSSRYQVFHDIYYLIRDTAAGEKVDRATLNSMTDYHTSLETQAKAAKDGEPLLPSQQALAGAAVIVSASKGRIFIKVCTNRAQGNGLFLSDEQGTPDLDRLRAGGRLDPQIVTPDRAVSLMENAAEQGYTVIDRDGELAKLGASLSKMTVAQQVAGAPGQSRLVVGSKVKATLGEAEDRLPKRSSGQTVRSAIVPAGVAGTAVDLAQQAGAVATIDSRVADIIAMSHAEPVAAEAPDAELTLRDYQREAVGLHLATEVGYLQACSVGLGKTAITLRGMRGWAERGRAS